MKYLDRLLVLPAAAWVLFAASVWSLLFALTAQYGFDIQPCVLCLWQRVPFIAVAVLAGLVLTGVAPEKCQRYFLWFSALIFAAGAGLAVFHTGVEQHWWMGTSGCAVQPLNSVEALLATPVARCDQISWTFLGLSMANWNIPFSLGLAGFAVMAARRK